MGRREPYRYALGMVETTGKVGSINALDAMTKTADVTLLSSERVGGGLHTIFVQGTVAAVKVATAAGAEAASAVGELRVAHIIPKPSPELRELLLSGSRAGRKEI